MYYLLLGIIWFAACAITALMLADLSHDRQLMPGILRWSTSGLFLRILIRRRIVLTVIVFIGLVGYVLSYPFVLVQYIPRPSRSPLDLYTPVEWLIDNTPLDGPIFDWAAYCGNRQPLLDATAVRQRGTIYSVDAWKRAVANCTVAIASVLIPALISIVAARRIRRRLSPAVSRVSEEEPQPHTATPCVASETTSSPASTMTRLLPSGVPLPTTKKQRELVMISSLAGILLAAFLGTVIMSGILISRPSVPSKPQSDPENFLPLVLHRINPDGPPEDVEITHWWPLRSMAQRFRQFEEELLGDVAAFKRQQEQQVIEQNCLLAAWDDAILFDVYVDLVDDSFSRLEKTRQQLAQTEARLQKLREKFPAKAARLKYVQRLNEWTRRVDDRVFWPHDGAADFVDTEFEDIVRHEFSD